MNKELIIDARSSEVDIALLEDNKLVELSKEKHDHSFSVGDVYLGKVKKIMPGLNAAFVDVGYERDAFLHYLDLGPQVLSLQKFTKWAMAGRSSHLNIEKFNLEKDIVKTGKITDVVSSGQQVLVQVAKEPISTKGPRISSEISFAGRYIVLVPFSNRISISQKIKNNDERKRLKKLIKSIVPNNFGVIIRTVAENKKVADLHADMNHLLKKWNAVPDALKTAKAPQKVVSELDRTTAMLRDMLNDNFNSIHVNSPDIYEDAKKYIERIAPDKMGIVNLYKGKPSIFEQFGVDKQIKNSFGRIVTIRSGIYLIIEHTEALHVIDVNSGHRVNKKHSQEQNALEVNLEAAEEITRQLRLRDMGGIIVIDFIDMHEAANRRKLFEHIKTLMSTDNAKHSVLPPTKFGLIQITRQRVRPEMKIHVLEKCPVCKGTGEIRQSILLIDDIENNLKYLIQDQNEKRLTLMVHPFIHAFITHGLSSIRLKWYFKYKQWIRIVPVSTYNYLEFHFFNKNDDEIKM
ncbi:MAG: Rne/Rng family ribonuclease [Bacteroidota bacterium]|nr:Rne/Rng family ribonuclease [Bacteroidota bacterium]